MLMDLSLAGWVGNQWPARELLLLPLRQVPLLNPVNLTKQTRLADQALSRPTAAHGSAPRPPPPLRMKLNPFAASYGFPASVAHCPLDSASLSRMLITCGGCQTSEIRVLIVMWEELDLEGRARSRMMVRIEIETGTGEVIVIAVVLVMLTTVVAVGRDGGHGGELDGIVMSPS